MENPQHSIIKKPKPLPFVAVSGTLLSMNYIRERALKILGDTVTKTNHHNQHTTTYHTTIPGVKFVRQNNEGQDGSPTNSETSMDALIMYFAFLLRAKQIKKGNKFFRWDAEEMMFVETK